MEKAVIYNRCSTEEEAQINALEIQAAESREIVLQKGWQIVGQYIESQSGTTAEKRTEYQRLLQDMETDQFDIVVIKSIDRLMRSAKDWYEFIDRLTRNGKRLYIYIDHKFYTPDDSLLTGIKAILAEDFSRELSKKIKNAHKRRQEKKTGYNITVPMFGWDKITKDEYRINESEAEAYRLAFALAEEGKGFYTIANQMYEKGVRGKNGNRISDVQWRKMLYSPRAHGTVVLHTQEYDFERKKKVKLPEEKWVYIEDALPPIVSREYHRKVLDIMAVRKKESLNNRSCAVSRKKNMYAFSGKVICGLCGAVYYRTVERTKQGHKVVWKCSTALKNGRKTGEGFSGCSNVHMREEILLDEIGKSIFEDSETEKELISKWESEFYVLIREAVGSSRVQQDKAKWQKELEKADRKRNVLLNKLMEEVITDEEFCLMHEKLEENRKKIILQIKELEVQEKEDFSGRRRLEEIREVLGRLMKQAAVLRFISHMERVIVYPNGRLELFHEYR